MAHFSEAVVLKEVKRRLDVIKAGVLARRAVLTDHRAVGGDLVGAEGVMTFLSWTVGCSPKALPR